MGLRIVSVKILNKYEKSYSHPNRYAIGNDRISVDAVTASRIRTGIPINMANSAAHGL